MAGSGKRGMKNCCVIGPVKSGTTLMISLLDSHPQLSLFPLEVKFLTHWFESLSYRPTTYEDLTSFFLERSKIRLMNGELGVERDIMNSGRIDFSGFDFRQFHNLIRSQSESIKFNNHAGDDLFVKFYKDVHAALDLSISRETANWIVSKEGNHGAKHIRDIQNILPSTKFIVLCRDPRDIYASYKAISLRKAEGLRSPTFKLYVSACSYVHDNKGKNITAYEDVFSHYVENTDFLFVHYERLVSQVSEEMHRVANFLGIEFDEVLTQPTNLGNPWGGNASELMRFDGVKQERVSKWHSDLTGSEIQLLEYFFFRYLSQCDYECKRERIKQRQVIGSVLVTEVDALRDYMRSATFMAITKRLVKTIFLSIRSVVCTIWAPEKLGR